MYEDGEEVIDTSRGSLLHFVPSMQMKLLKGKFHQASASYML